MSPAGVDDDDVKVLLLELLHSVCCYDHWIYFCVAGKEEVKIYTSLASFQNLQKRGCLETLT